MTFDRKFSTLRETAGTLVVGLTLYGIVLLTTHGLDGLGPLVIALVLLVPLLREGRKTKTPQERAEKYPLTQIALSCVRRERPGYGICVVGE
jgi:hypothetical protein